MKVVKIVEIHFLMKGHTHDKIDTMFGIYSKRLKKMSWSHPSDLVSNVQR